MDNPMMNDVPAATLWDAKLGGALAGSAISLAYLLPKNRREAALRFLSGLAGGMVFGATVGLSIASQLGITALLTPVETVLMGSATASLSLWWALGFVLRFAERRSAMTEARR